MKLKRDTNVAISQKIKSNYTRILNTELKMALGCTEPIAIAYCAAYARKILGKAPERYVVYCSGNIIKNVKAVTVPKTGGLKGIQAAALAGGIGGDADAELRVLESLTDEDRAKIRSACAQDIVEVKLLESGHALHIIIHVFAGEDEASVEIIDNHTGIGRVERNGEVLHERRDEVAEQDEAYTSLNIADILEYAKEVELGVIRDCLLRQIQCNGAIAREGLKNIYGAGIGPILMKNAGESLREQAMATAAAASDARMNGSAMPVVINSGSGNQGITVSVPVLVFAQDMQADEETLLRALCVANLVAIHQKTGIGKLSAFCGATCAAAGAVAGIAFMRGEDYEVIAQLVSNALATVGGMICDGAKSSCAGKIAVALDAAFLGYEAAKQQRSYKNGEGIVHESVEGTIDSIGRIASKGMYSTDIEILNIMLEN